jgi:hypothetical protein
VFVVRRAGASDEERRTVVGIDIGLGARHRRGARVVMGPAPLRETMAAQLIMLSRWDARTEPLVDPMAGGGTIPIEAAGLAVGVAIRKPMDLPLAISPRSRICQSRRPTFSRHRAAHPRARRDPARISTWWGTFEPPGCRSVAREIDRVAQWTCARWILRRAHATAPAT